MIAPEEARVEIPRARANLADAHRSPELAAERIGREIARAKRDTLDKDSNMRENIIFGDPPHVDEEIKLDEMRALFGVPIDESARAVMSGELPGRTEGPKMLVRYGDAEEYAVRRPTDAETEFFEPFY